MFQRHGYLLFFAFTFTFSFSQNTTLLPKKFLDAKKIEGKIDIDGKLDENDWQSAVAADSFVTFQPVPGLKASEDGQIRVLYDNGWII